ncbi:MAG: hypothetical protein LBD67_04285 [Candidatus Accumulibacter sp.]|jgi:hypothetical protein|nr:hypothetical protein [Accumulibacter sp.]
MIDIDSRVRVFLCPKCKTHFEDPLDGHSQCPACGLWFHKWKSVPRTGRRADRQETPDFDEILRAQKIPANPFVLYAQVAIIVFIALWGLILANYDYRTAEINASFMHLILLPIHEAGHVVFTPLGEFMHVLGGSLFQVALPLGIAYAFQSRQADSFGAAICLWWGGASLVDLAPYIWDAIDQVLPLVGGGEHDWFYLLSRLGLLERAPVLAITAHHAGVTLMCVGVFWASSFLYEVRRTQRAVRRG